MQAIGDGISRSSIEKLSALRTRIVVMADQEAPMSSKSRRTATKHGGSTLTDLQQALEDYLPVLLGLVESENSIQHRFQFSWLNQEVNAEETNMSNSWYEVLSVLHLMAMLSLSQANEEFFRESKKAEESFHNTLPLSRNPPVWGTSKFLSKKIPENNSSKMKTNSLTERPEE